MVLCLPALLFVCCVRVEVETRARCGRLGFREETFICEYKEDVLLGEIVRVVRQMGYTLMLIVL